MVGNENSGRKSEKEQTTVKSGTTSSKYFGKILEHTNDLNSSLQSPAQVLQDMTVQKQKEVLDKIKGYEIISSLKNKGIPPHLLSEFEKTLGLDNPQTEQQVKHDLDSTKMMILQMAQQENDPVAKALLLSAFANGKIDQSMVTAMMLRKSPEKDNKSEIEKGVLQLAIDLIKEQSKPKSEIEQAKNLISMMKEMQDLTGGKKEDLTIEKILDIKGKLTELGLVQDPTSSIEERRLDIEMKKVELEHERITKQDEAKIAHEKATMDTIGKAVQGTAQALTSGLTSFLNKGKSNQSTQPQQPPKQNAYTTVPVECQNPQCVDKDGKRRIINVTFDEPRDFECPFGCSFKYGLRTDNSTEAVNNLAIFLSAEDEAKLNPSQSS